MYKAQLIVRVTHPDGRIVERASGIEEYDLPSLKEAFLAKVFYDLNEFAGRVMESVEFPEPEPAKDRAPKARRKAVKKAVDE